MPPDSTATEIISFSIRLDPTDAERLDRLVDAYRQQRGDGIPRVTRSSALRDLLRDWERGATPPPKEA